MRSPREDFEAAGKRLPWDAAARNAALSATAPVSDVKASANGVDNASNAEHSDDMPTVPIPARKAATTFDTPSKRERIEVKPPITRFIRRAVTRVFGVWSRISTQVVRQWDWYPRVEPYVGYGTGDYSRLICRTVYAPRHAQSGELIRGIRGMLAIPAPRTHVQASIDDMPLNTVQIGVSEVYDKVDRTRDLGSEYAISDSAGYLDLVAEHRLVPGIHRVSPAHRSSIFRHRPGMWRVRFATSSLTMVFPKARCCCATSTRGPRPSYPPAPSTNLSLPNNLWPTSQT